MEIGEPTVTMLSTAAGLAVVVSLVMQLLRPVVPEGTYDRWGPLLAVVVGTAFALAYTVASVSPITGNDLLQAVLVGLFGGFLSQNANTLLTRALARPSKNL